MKSYTVTEQTTLKEFTDNVCAQASFCLSALFRAREVKVNGKKVGEDVTLFSGDVVQFFMTKAQESKQAFAIIYENDDVIVVDKESGVNSEAVFSALSEVGECYFIHRLDRNTSGLLVFGKNKTAEEALLKAFKEKTVTKIYNALVVGRMPKQHDTLNAYLKKDGKNSLVKVSSSPVGEKIVTEYEVLKTDGETSLLKITLHTGKTHQIRAHMAFVGHPVVGDTKYGNGEFNRAHKVTRQRLVAKQLQIESDKLPSIKGKVFLSRHRADEI